MKGSPGHEEISDKKDKKPPIAKEISTTHEKEIVAL
jgi:hypothetical protein